MLFSDSSWILDGTYRKRKIRFWTVAAPLISILGPTGAGKSVQAKVLAEAKGWTHVSSGELLRHNRDPQLQATLASGRLAPSEAVLRLLEEALVAVPFDVPIVIDGFPRKLQEAVWLDELLHRMGRWRRDTPDPDATEGRRRGPRGVAHVFLLDVDRATSEGRLSGRGRADDEPESLERKWDEFRRDTHPVLDMYRQRGQLIDIDGRGSVGAVAERIGLALEKLSSG